MDNIYKNKEKEFNKTGGTKNNDNINQIKSKSIEKKTTNSKIMKNNSKNNNNNPIDNNQGETFGNKKTKNAQKRQKTPP